MQPRGDLDNKHSAKGARERKGRKLRKAAIDSWDDRYGVQRGLETNEEASRSEAVSESVLARDWQDPLT